MAAGNIKIHAFQVTAAENSQPMESVLAKIQGDPIDKRQRLVSQADIRMDDVVSEDGVWLMDFVLERFEGPGRVTPSAVTQDFNMGKDDRFGEETAALYDPKSGYFLCQYNHRGVKSGRMFGYLAEYDRGHASSYEGNLVLDPKAKAKLARMTLARRLLVGIDPGALSKKDRQANLAMSFAADAESRFDANHIEVTVAVRGGPSERLQRNPVTQLLSSLRKITGRSPDAVSKLKYYGKESDDGGIEEIDLLGQRLKMTVPNVPIGQGRRLTREGRYKALRRVWQEWKPILNI
ncbi:MAG: hypothetical protein RJQ08_08465 [Salinisphaeraceae bacterium]